MVYSSMRLSCVLFYKLYVSEKKKDSFYLKFFYLVFIISSCESIRSKFRQSSFLICFIFIQIMYSCICQHFVVDKEVASCCLTIRSENNISGISHHFYFEGEIKHTPSSSHISNNCCPNSSSWPKRINSKFLFFEFLTHSQYTHTHAPLLYSVCPQTYPLEIEGKWRGEIENMRIGGFEQMWNTILGDHKGSAETRLMRKIVAFHAS